MPKSNQKTTTMEFIKNLEEKSKLLKKDLGAVAYNTYIHERKLIKLEEEIKEVKTVIDSLNTLNQKRLSVPLFLQIQENKTAALTLIKNAKAFVAINRINKGQSQIKAELLELNLDIKNQP